MRDGIKRTLPANGRLPPVTSPGAIPWTNWKRPNSSSTSYEAPRTTPISLTPCVGADARWDKAHPSRKRPATAGNESGRDPLDELEATEFLVDKLRSTKNNADFFDSMRRG